jgi:hypothetical protein
MCASTAYTALAITSLHGVSASRACASVETKPKMLTRSATPESSVTMSAYSLIALPSIFASTYIKNYHAKMQHKSRCFSIFIFKSLILVITCGMLTDEMRFGGGAYEGYLIQKGF